MAQKARTTARGVKVLIATEKVIAPIAKGTDAILIVEAKGDRLLERAQKTQPDVILVDLALPGLSGSELISALKAVTPVAQLILTSSINDSLDQLLAPRRRRRHSKRRAVAAVAAVFERMGLTSAELKDVADAVADSLTTHYEPSLSAENIAERMAGPAPSVPERAYLEFDALHRYFKERRHLLQGSLTTEQVAKLFGTSRQTPHDRVRAGTVLAVHDGGRLRFPPWQFDPEADDGLVEGVPETLRALRVSPLAAARWLTRPNPVFGGQTPLDLLRAGDVQRVVSEAAGVGPNNV